jgi:hypothetical protein
MILSNNKEADKKEIAAALDLILSMCLCSNDYDEIQQTWLL